MNHKLKHGVVVQRDYQKVPLLVNSFGSELNQIWTNLIDNAIDAMGGKAVNCGFGPYREDNCVVVEIGDSGPGISPESSDPAFLSLFYDQEGSGKAQGLVWTQCNELSKSTRVTFK